jgi:hypothetical protein
MRFIGSVNFDISGPASSGAEVRWLAEVTAGCPRRKSIDMSDQCGARSPDLPKVL